MYLNFRKLYRFRELSRKNSEFRTYTLLGMKNVEFEDELKKEQKLTKYLSISRIIVIASQFIKNT